MKKLLAITVIFALVAGAAFADTSVGGNVKFGLQLIAGDFDGSDVGAGRVEAFDVHTNIGYGDSENGGMMRLWTKTNQWQPDMFAFLWFTPIEMLRIQIGKNADGDFGHAQIAGWGFNAEAQGGVALDQHRLLSGSNIIARTAGWGGAAGGFGDLGLAITLKPADVFTLNLGIPFPSTASDSSYVHNRNGLDTTWGSSLVNAVINITDIGTIRVSGKFNGVEANDDLKPIGVAASFYLSAIEGMGLEIGFEDNTDFENPQIGLGFRFGGEGFTIKARAGFVLAENNMAVGLHILPSFSLGDATLFINAGFAYGIDAEQLAFYLNPYVAIPFGGVKLYAGIQLFDNGDEVIKWAVPISFNVYF